MKKITGFMLALVFSGSSLANDKDDILELCSVAKKGSFSQIQAKGQLQADGSIKLVTLGGKGEVSFSKGNWDGIQQVLKSHQATDNVTARDCVIKLMPYFKSKVTTAKTTNKAQSQPAKKAQPTPQKTQVAKSAEKPSTTCTIEGDQDVCGNTTGGDININFGAKP